MEINCLIKLGKWNKHEVCQLQNIPKVYTNTGIWLFQQSPKRLMGKDLKKRKQFARETLKKEDGYWTKEIAFYLNGVSFVYKGIPLSDMIKPKV